MDNEERSEGKEDLRIPTSIIASDSYIKTIIKKETGLCSNLVHPELVKDRKLQLHAKSLLRKYRHAK